MKCMDNYLSRFPPPLSPSPHPFEHVDVVLMNYYARCRAITDRATNYHATRIEGNSIAPIGFFFFFSFEPLELFGDRLHLFPVTVRTMDWVESDPSFDLFSIARYFGIRSVWQVACV